MREARVWKELLGVEQTVVEGVRLDEREDAVIVSVHAWRRRWEGRCGRCRRRGPCYDRARRRRWRAPDMGLKRVFLEADGRRVNCPVHGPTVAAVPWARHGAGHTLAFDQTVTWLAARTDQSTISELMRVAWRTVGSIIDRVIADGEVTRPVEQRLDGLRRIGIDEVSYRRGYKYLTVVTDHDTGKMVWAAPGRDKKTLAGFFDLLGPQRCAQLRLVSCDGADWIADLVALRVPNARMCMDPFHVVAWVQGALDEVRRAATREARRRKDPAASRALFRARHALWKNSRNLTPKQKDKLAWVQREHDNIHRAWQLKEQLCAAFAAGGADGVDLLDTFYQQAASSGLTPFVTLAAKMRRFYDDICHTLNAGLTNARAEAINNHIRLITRRAYGFHSVDALLALVKLRVGGYGVPLPGRP